MVVPRVLTTSIPEDIVIDIHVWLAQIPHGQDLIYLGNSQASNMLVGVQDKGFRIGWEGSGDGDSIVCKMMPVAMLGEGSICPGFPQDMPICVGYHSIMIFAPAGMTNYVIIVVLLPPRPWEHQSCAFSGTMRLDFSGLLFWGCSLHLWSDLVESEDWPIFF